MPRLFGGAYSPGPSIGAFTGAAGFSGGTPGTQQTPRIGVRLPGQAVPTSPAIHSPQALEGGRAIKEVFVVSRCDFCIHVECDRTADARLGNFCRRYETATESVPVDGFIRLRVVTGGPMQTLKGMEVVARVRSTFSGPSCLRVGIVPPELRDLLEQDLVRHNFVGDHWFGTGSAYDQFAGLEFREVCISSPVSTAGVAKK